MSTLKRAWDSMVDSDDEDEPSMGRQILPVARLPETFSGEPKDGMQYLFTVRRDARKLPSITHVENPYRNLSIPKNEAREAKLPRNTRVPLPSEEWRTIFVKRFRNFRKNSTQATIGVALPISSSTGHSKHMPERKERDKWWDFINGRPECEWNPPKKAQRRWAVEATRRDAEQMNMRQTSDADVRQYEVPMVQDAVEEALVINEYGEVADGEADMDIEPPESAEGGPGSFPTAPQPDSRYRLSDNGPRHPSPALLKPMDSRYCMHLLMYFTHWITQHLKGLESDQATSSPLAHLSQNHALWMFALLSRVDEQLTSDELSTLRALARACIAFIKDLNKNNASGSGARYESDSALRWVGEPGDAPLDERACWMIVALITEFWGQKDLWMDAESALC